MVLAGKVFKLREPLTIAEIAHKLRGYRIEEEYVEEPHRFNLLTEVFNLNLINDELKGVYSKDVVLHIPRRGEVVPVVRTVEAPFMFTRRGNEVLLTVLGKKNKANFVANELSKLLFIVVGGIVEARIPPEALKQYHEQNPAETKVIFFDNVDIPNIDKLSLYGPDLKNTSLYNEYLSHGQIWYVVASSRRYGYVVGITRNSVVTVFSRVNEHEFFNFVKNEVFQLIS
ncbi:MAG: hypothetical protein QXQ92_06615 [Candidatus Nezhaarchaeales archaeon]